MTYCENTTYHSLYVGMVMKFKEKVEVTAHVHQAMWYAIVDVLMKP